MKEISEYLQKGVVMRVMSRMNNIVLLLVAIVFSYQRTCTTVEVSDSNVSDIVRSFQVAKSKHGSLLRGATGSMTMAQDTLTGNIYVSAGKSPTYMLSKIKRTAPAVPSANPTDAEKLEVARGSAGIPEVTSILLPQTWEKLHPRYLNVMTSSAGTKYVVFAGSYDRVDGQIIAANDRKWYQKNMLYLINDAASTENSSLEIADILGHTSGSASATSNFVADTATTYVSDANYRESKIVGVETDGVSVIFVAVAPAVNGETIGDTNVQGQWGDNNSGIAVVTYDCGPVLRQSSIVTRVDKTSSDFYIGSQLSAVGSGDPQLHWNNDLKKLYLGLNEVSSGAQNGNGAKSLGIGSLLLSYRLFDVTIQLNSDAIPTAEADAVANVKNFVAQYYCDYVPTSGDYVATQRDGLTALTAAPANTFGSGSLIKNSAGLIVGSIVSGADGAAAGTNFKPKICPRYQVTMQLDAAATALTAASFVNLTVAYFSSGGTQITPTSGTTGDKISPGTITPMVVSGLVLKDDDSKAGIVVAGSGVVATGKISRVVPRYPTAAWDLDGSNGAGTTTGVVNVAYGIISTSTQQAPAADDWIDTQDSTTAFEIHAGDVVKNGSTVKGVVVENPYPALSCVANGSATDTAYLSSTGVAGSSVAGQLQTDVVNKYFDVTIQLDSALPASEADVKNFVAQYYGGYVPMSGDYVATTRDGLTALANGAATFGSGSLIKNTAGVIVGSIVSGADGTASVNYKPMICPRYQVTMQLDASATTLTAASFVNLTVAYFYNVSATPAQITPTSGLTGDKITQTATKVDISPMVAAGIIKKTNDSLAGIVVAGAGVTVNSATSRVVPRYPTAAWDLDGSSGTGTTTGVVNVAYGINTTLQAPAANDWIYTQDRTANLFSIHAGDVVVNSITLKGVVVENPYPALTCVANSNNTDTAYLSSTGVAGSPVAGQLVDVNNIVLVFQSLTANDATGWGNGLLNTTKQFIGVQKNAANGGDLVSLSVHHLTTMKTLDNRYYLILNGGNGTASETYQNVVAIPLVTSNGTLAKFTVSSTPASNLIDFTTQATDGSTLLRHNNTYTSSAYTPEVAPELAPIFPIVGYQLPPTKSIDSPIVSMKSQGESVFILVKSLSASENGESEPGLYVSQPMIDYKKASTANTGTITRWGAWQKVWSPTPANSLNVDYVMNSYNDFAIDGLSGKMFAMTNATDAGGTFDYISCTDIVPASSLQSDSLAAVVEKIVEGSSKQAVLSVPRNNYSDSMVRRHLARYLFVGADETIAIMRLAKTVYDKTNTNASRDYSNTLMMLPIDSFAATEGANTLLTKLPSLPTSTDVCAGDSSPLNSINCIGFAYTKGLDTNILGDVCCNYTRGNDLDRVFLFAGTDQGLYVLGDGFSESDFYTDLTSHNWKAARWSKITTIPAGEKVVKIKSAGGALYVMTIVTASNSTSTTNKIYRFAENMSAEAYSETSRFLKIADTSATAAAGNVGGVTINDFLIIKGDQIGNDTPVTEHVLLLTSGPQSGATGSGLFESTAMSKNTTVAPSWFQRNLVIATDSDMGGDSPDNVPFDLVCPVESTAIDAVNHSFIVRASYRTSNINDHNKSQLIRITVSRTPDNAVAHPTGSVVNTLHTFNAVKYNSDSSSATFDLNDALPRIVGMHDNGLQRFMLTKPLFSLSVNPHMYVAPYRAIGLWGCLTSDSLSKFLIPDVALSQEAWKKASDHSKGYVGTLQDFYWMQQTNIGDLLISVKTTSGNKIYAIS